MAVRAATRSRVVNCVGAPWYEDLSPAFLDECYAGGVGVVGCTANETWDDTLESIENLQYVKEVVREHEHAYLVQSAADLDTAEHADKVGVVLGFQNPKALSDSLHFLEAFIDMGLRCCSLAFRENSYYGCGYVCPIDTGLTQLGRQAVKTMNRRGVVVDLSHSGDRTAMDAVELSEHPMVFSHSGARQVVLDGVGVRRRAMGVRDSAVLRAAPDELIKAAAAKGGVICQDARTATIADFVDQLDYLVQLVGPDHVGVAAQDDWHRSEKDARRIQAYLPGYDSVEAMGARAFGTDYRIYRREDQMGPKLLYSETLAAALLARGYSEEDAGKILGGNLMRLFRQVLP